ncbi:MAG: hypothetical protein K0R24_1729 [Gammaproteobacteria bacterium]|jgi:hypothetical protein|nr:hypothetical protein [Gammaproteobacteria bacterium]
MINQARHTKNLFIIDQLKKGSVTPDLLKQYSGWGGLQAIIAQPDVYKTLREILNEDEIKSLKQTVKNAYYTPAMIVKFTYDWLIHYGFTGGAILEPAVGHGVFMEYMPQAIKQNSSITAVELDKLTSQITKYLYPSMDLYTCGFEEFHPKNQFDLIIGNPPYGGSTVYDNQHPDLKDYCIHHYFVAKSMRLLKEGGILAMVLPSYFMDNITKHVRGIIHQEGGSLITAYRLPDDLFDNAKVTVDIVFLTKGKTENPWLKVKDIGVSGVKKPINEFFYQQSGNILGNLELVDMYERKGLTCKRRGDIDLLLTQEIKNMKLQKFAKQYLASLDKHVAEVKSIAEMLCVF